ncbi:hypothetical protein AC480_03795 [miscellaneous Crenarchaeota group archaeon SMTZ1-55]|nr:MAG: hypothetical protein AC480_03795 [miscellaneous Crenarchaeota group archaeon SMTZ1-55]
MKTDAVSRTIESVGSEDNDFSRDPSERLVDKALRLTRSPGEGGYKCWLDDHRSSVDIGLEDGALEQML